MDQTNKVNTIQKRVFTLCEQVYPIKDGKKTPRGNIKNGLKKIKHELANFTIEYKDGLQHVTENLKLWKIFFEWHETKNKYKKKKAYITTIFQ